LAGATAGRLGAGSPPTNAVIVGIGFLLGAIFFGVWWTILEMTRRGEERELNREYEEERRQHKAMRREHAERCKRELKEKQDHERRKYDARMAQWNRDILPYRKEAARRREAIQSATAQLRRAEQQWKATSDASIQLFDRKRAELARLKDDYDTVESQRDAEWKQMLAKARENQFHEHLRLHLVEHAVIENIGPARKRALKANGIVAALDVTRSRIKRIQGFGDALTDNIVRWRRDQVETSFIFKTANAIHPQDTKAFDVKYDHLRQLIQRQLNDGEDELKRISKEAEKSLGQLAQNIKICVAQVGQAESDLAVIPSGL
jgi:DNA-binding helix-hairpin-helix protein with protein kinase domain